MLVQPLLNGHKDEFIPSWSKVKGTDFLPQTQIRLTLYLYKLMARICLFRVECWEQGYVYSRLNARSKIKFTLYWMVGARICLFGVEWWEQGYFYSGLTARSKIKFTPSWMLGLRLNLLRVEWGGGKNILIPGWMLGARICSFRVKWWEQGYFYSGLTARSKIKFTPG